MPPSKPSLICSDIRVGDLARALRFYRALGLRLVAKGEMEDGTSLAWLQDPGTRQLLELFHLSRRSPLYRPLRQRPAPENALIFSLRDVGGLLPRLRRHGAKLLSDFQDGEVRLTFVRDPDGTLLEFVSWTTVARKAHRRAPLLGIGLARHGPTSRQR